MNKKHTLYLSFFLMIFFSGVITYTSTIQGQVSCGTDTTGYTGRLKEILGATNHLMTKKDTSGWGMGFILNQNVIFYGFKFFAYAPTKKAQIRARLYTSKNALPETLLESKNITIDVNTAPVEHLVIFNKPRILTDSFFLTVERITPFDVIVETSNGITVFPRFGVYKQAGTWKNIENDLGVFNEPNMWPIISYDIFSAFTVDNVILSEGDTVNATTCQQLIFRHSGASILRNHMFMYRIIHPGDPTLWKFGDGATGNNILLPESHKYTNPGVFRAVLIDTVEGYDNTIHCIDSFFVFINVTGASCKTGGLDKNDIGGTEKEMVEVYPNPSTGIINIEYQGQITIYDNLGRSIYQGEEKNTFNLPIGIYFIIVNDNGQLSRSKAIVK